MSGKLCGGTPHSGSSNGGVGLFFVGGVWAGTTRLCQSRHGERGSKRGRERKREIEKERSSERERERVSERERERKREIEGG